MNIKKKVISLVVLFLIVGVLIIIFFDPFSGKSITEEITEDASKTEQTSESTSNGTSDEVKAIYKELENTYWEGESSESNYHDYMIFGEYDGSKYMTFTSVSYYNDGDDYETLDIKFIIDDNLKTMYYVEEGIDDYDMPRDFKYKNGKLYIKDTWYHKTTVDAVSN